MTTDEADDAQPLTNDNLDDVFEGSDDAETAAPVAEPAKAEPKGETSTAEPKDKSITEDDAEEPAEEDAEPPAAEDDTEDDGKSVPVAALKSERSKRQAAEAEVTRLKKKLEPEKSEGEQEAEHVQFAHRTDISRELMMDEHDDYEKMEEIFTEIAKGQPELIEQMMAAKNPAKFAYETASNHPKGQEYREFLEFQKAKKAAAAAPKEKPVEPAPKNERKKSALQVPNLNQAASVSSNSTPKEKLETLDEMFKD